MHVIISFKQVKRVRKHLQKRISNPDSEYLLGFQVIPRTHLLSQGDRFPLLFSVWIKIFFKISRQSIPRQPLLSRSLNKLDFRGRNEICNTNGMEKYLLALLVFQTYFHDFVVAQTLPLP